MSIATELTKLQTNLANAYAAVSNKGGTVPEDQTFANLDTAISSISTGGTGDDNYTAYIDIENMIKGTSYVETTEMATACTAIKEFIYGANS